MYTWGMCNCYRCFNMGVNSFTWIYIACCLIISTVVSVEIGVTGTSYTITCDLTSPGDYPQWTGPPNALTKYNFEKDPTFNPAYPRLSWSANKKDLVISNLTRTDAGLYRCFANDTNSDIKDLQVRVKPSNPVITNTDNPGSNQVTGTEGTSLALECISSGGYPQQTVKWYKGTVTNTPLASNSTADHDTVNDLYDVTSQYTFPPTTSDDRENFICQSSYDTEPFLAESSSVQMYLNLKPSPPVITLNQPKEGEIVRASCVTSGFRPESSFSLKWTFSGQTTIYNSNPVRNDTTDTFSVTDTFQKTVNRSDNENSITCAVGHVTLSTDLSDNKVVNVKFDSKRVSIEGNREFTVNGKSLPLICRASSSNPASDLQWYHDGNGIANDGPYSDFQAEYSGIERTQVLQFTPTREMDGDTIVCSVSNEVNLPNTVTDSVTLSLRYNPVVTVSENTSFTEGQNGQLDCSADSKPVSTFIWKHNNIVQISTTPTSNSLPFIIRNASRMDYGKYTCKADNGIQTSDEKQLFVIITFVSLTTTINGNLEITANGINTLTLTCTTGEANPRSTITWKKNNEGITATQILPDVDGEFGGKRSRSVLTLTPTREDDGINIFCYAENTVNINNMASSNIQLNLKYTPIIFRSANQTVTEGDSKALLSCSASSNPPSIFKFFKIDAQELVYQGSGTQQDNGLIYSIENPMRHHAGTYRCNADNSIGVDDKYITLIVQYAPNVTMSQSTSTVTEGVRTDLICNAFGVPASYTFTSVTQTWKGVSIPNTNTDVPNTLPNSSIRLKSAQIQDSGMYTCRVNNGIKDLHGNLEQAITREVLVKGRPKLHNKATKFAGVTFGTAYITTPFYSYPQYTTINFIRQRDMMDMANQNKSSITTSATVIETAFYDTAVTLDGYITTLMIPDLREDDFGNYTVFLENEVGNTSANLTLVAESKPLSPTDVHFVSILVPSFSWRGNFNGGHAQIFVIQTSLVNDNNWINQTFIEESDNQFLQSDGTYHANVTGLSPGEYNVQIVSYNIKGWSEPVTLESSFEIKDTTEDGGHVSTSSLIAGAVGGGVSVVLIVIIGIVAFVMIYRKTKRSNASDKQIWPPKGIWAQRNGTKIAREAPTYADLQLERSSSETYEHIQSSTSDAGYVQTTHIGPDTLNDTYTGLTQYDNIQNTYSRLGSTTTEDNTPGGTTYANLTLQK